MDSTAISLCKDNNLPIIIFNLNQHGNIRRVVTGGEDRVAGERVSGDRGKTRPRIFARIRTDPVNAPSLSP